MLSKIKRALLGATALVMFAGAAHAEVTGHWTTTASGWSVDIHDTGNCTSQRRYPGGTKLLFGWEPKQGGIWMGFSHADWKAQVVESKDYQVTMVTDGKTWKATPYYGHITDTDGAFISSINFSPTFMGAMAAGNKVEFWLGSTWVATLPLVGSAEAINELLDCQKAQNAKTSQVTPPSNSVAARGDDAATRSEAKQWNVPIVRNGSSIHLEATLNNGTPITFMLDTGATTVNITEPMRVSMGLPIVRYATVTYGDGRKGQEPVVMLKRLTVGNVYLTDIEATVGGNVPLIGKNFLDAFSSYEINNASAMLVLKK